MGDGARERWLLSAVMAVGVFIFVLAGHRTLLVQLSHGVEGGTALLGREQASHEAAYSLFMAGRGAGEMMSLAFSLTDAGRRVRPEEHPPASLLQPMQDMRLEGGQEAAETALRWAVKQTPAVAGELFRPLVTVTSLVTFSFAELLSSEKLNLATAVVAQQLANVMIHCLSAVAVFFLLTTAFSFHGALSLLSTAPAAAGALLFGILPTSASSIVTPYDGRAAGLSFLLSTMAAQQLLVAAALQQPLAQRTVCAMFGSSLVAALAFADDTSVASSAVIVVLPLLLATLESGIRGFIRTLPITGVGLSAAFAAAAARAGMVEVSLMTTAAHDLFSWESLRTSLGAVLGAVQRVTPSFSTAGFCFVAFASMVIAVAIEATGNSEKRSTRRRLGSIRLAGVAVFLFISAVLWTAPIAPRVPPITVILLTAIAATAATAVLYTAVMLVHSAVPKAQRRTALTCVIVAVAASLLAVAVAGAAKQAEAAQGHAQLLHTEVINNGEDIAQAAEALARHFLRRNSTVARHFIARLGRSSAASVLEGKLALLKGRESDALNHFMAVVEEDPYHTVNNDIGIVLWRSGHEEAAFARFLKAMGSKRVTSMAERLGVLNNVACAHFSRQPEFSELSLFLSRHCQAELLLHRHAEALQGSLAVFDFNLASNLYRAGGSLRAEALAHYETAAALDPGRFASTLAAYEQQQRLPGSRPLTPQCTFVYV